MESTTDPVIPEPIVAVADKLDHSIRVQALIVEDLADAIAEAAGAGLPTGTLEAHAVAALDLGLRLRVERARLLAGPETGGRLGDRVKRAGGTA